MGFLGVFFKNHKALSCGFLRIYSTNVCLFVAGGGLEPNRPPDYESGALPLRHPAMWNVTLQIYYTTKIYNIQI